MFSLERINVEILSLMHKVHVRNAGNSQELQVQLSADLINVNLDKNFLVQENVRIVLTTKGNR